MLHEIVKNHFIYSAEHSPCSFSYQLFWDGSIKLGDKDGEIQIGKTKWDKKEMFGLDAPKAKLTSSVSTEEGAMYFFSEMKKGCGSIHRNASGERIYIQQTCV